MKKIITLACFACLPLQTFADDKAFNILNKMTHALTSMSYQGKLIHVINNEPITLRVSHTIENGKEVEKVEHLHKDKDGVPYTRKVTNYSLSKLPKFNNKMKAVYSFDLGAIKKVANRSCQLVIARPKDRMRYLQKYCVDTQTSLLLDYTIIDKSHQPIERFMFTDVEIFEDKLDISNGVEALTPKAAVSIAAISVQSQVSTNTMATWHLKVPPKGFTLRKAPMMKQQRDEAKTEHYILTDGLSSVSIFISKKADNSTESGTRSGALNVITQYKGAFAITLVGEVPESTLKDIFNNLEHNETP